MRFECNPQLILNAVERSTLQDALKLCQDMDNATTAHFDEDNHTIVEGCEKCPFMDKCNHLTKDCVYIVAHKALQQIIDIAIVK